MPCCIFCVSYSELSVELTTQRTISYVKDSTMTEKTYSFGYELASKQVRKYRVNDLGSVRHALAANIQEYLAYEGVVEEEPESGKQMAFGAAVSFLGFSSYFLKSYTSLMVPLLGGFFVLFSIYCAQGLLQDTANQVFIGSGVIAPRSGSQNERALSKLQGKRLAVQLQTSPCSTQATLAVQIVGQPRTFAPARVIYSVEKTVSFSKYFGSTGYFFPPPLKADIDLALSELARF